MGAAELIWPLPKDSPTECMQAWEALTSCRWGPPGLARRAGSPRHPAAEGAPSTFARNGGVAGGLRPGVGQVSR